MTDSTHDVYTLCRTLVDIAGPFNPHPTIAEVMRYSPGRSRGWLIQGAHTSVHHETRYATLLTKNITKLPSPLTPYAPLKSLLMVLGVIMKIQEMESVHHW
jgi:hypothetical protein